MTSSTACAGEAACRPAVECYKRRQTTATDDRRQTPAIVTSLAPYTMCRRASNKLIMHRLILLNELWAIKMNRNNTTMYIQARDRICRIEKKDREQISPTLWTGHWPLTVSLADAAAVPTALVALHEYDPASLATTCLTVRLCFVPTFSINNRSDGANLASPLNLPTHHCDAHHFPVTKFRCAHAYIQRGAKKRP